MAARATLLAPCFIISVALASLNVLKPSSQNANESASAFTNSALVAFFSLSLPMLGLATPRAAAHAPNWALAACPMSCPNVRTSLVGMNV